MAGTQLDLAYSLNIRTSSELALFRSPSNFYLVFCDPILDVVWEGDRVISWPPLPGYTSSPDHPLVGRCMQLSYPVRLLTYNIS